jgi:hypothetical protein
MPLGVVEQTAHDPYRFGCVASAIMAAVVPTAASDT